MPNHISGPESKTAPAPDSARRNRTPYPDLDVKVIAIRSSPFTSPQPAAPSHHATRVITCCWGERGRQFFACHIGLTHQQFFTTVQFQFKTSCRALNIAPPGLCHWPAVHQGVEADMFRSAGLSFPVMPQTFSCHQSIKNIRCTNEPGATNGVRGRI